MATLVTSSGERVPELQMRPRHVIDRTTVLYGPSRTGKTVFIKNIMKLVDGHIDQVLVVSPTEPANSAYAGYVPPSLIHYNMCLPDPTDKKDTAKKSAIRFLETMYKRQELMASIFKRANDSDTLASLYARQTSKERAPGDKILASLARKRQRVVKNIQLQGLPPGPCEEKVKEINEKFTKMVTLVYKKILLPNIARLWKKKDLSDDERYALQYICFNPRLLLIFDDCAAQLKVFFSTDVFRKLFYQNRHSFITMVISCQDDTDLPANLRKNAFISIFTGEVIASANFNRGTNGFTKDTKEYVKAVTPELFTGYRKLAYIREDDTGQNFYHITCEAPTEFRFGSDALFELCSAVEVGGSTMDKDNPFYDRFKV